MSNSDLLPATVLRRKASGARQLCPRRLAVSPAAPRQRPGPPSSANATVARRSARGHLVEDAKGLSGLGLREVAG
jgi:hypothetical protein